MGNRNRSVRRPNNVEGWENTIDTVTDFVFIIERPVLLQERPQRIIGCHGVSADKVWSVSSATNDKICFIVNLVSGRRNEGNSHAGKVIRFAVVGIGIIGYDEFRCPCKNGRVKKLWNHRRRCRAVSLGYDVRADTILCNSTD